MGGASALAHCTLVLKDKLRKWYTATRREASPLEHIGIASR
jgi:hypothetical protein